MSPRDFLHFSLASITRLVHYSKVLLTWLSCFLLVFVRQKNGAPIFPGESFFLPLACLLPQVGCISNILVSWCCSKLLHHCQYLVSILHASIWDLILPRHRYIIDTPLHLPILQLGRLINYNYDTIYIVKQQWCKES